MFFSQGLSSSINMNLVCRLKDKTAQNFELLFIISYKKIKLFRIKIKYYLNFLYMISINITNVVGISNQKSAIKIKYHK